MTIELTTDQLEEIKEWEEGEQYELEMTVTQMEDTEEGRARFAVDQVQGSPKKSGDDAKPDEPAGSRVENGQNEKTENFKSALRQQIEGGRQQRAGGRY